MALSPVADEGQEAKAMGVAIFVGLVLIALGIIATVIGFLIYGMYLGVVCLARLLQELWQRLLAVNLELAEAEASALRQDSAVTLTVDGRPTTVHCWDYKQCPPAVRESCPAYQRPDVPCWLACMQSGEDYPLKPACLACKLFSLPMLVVEV